jgi:hypothetical protein
MENKPVKKRVYRLLFSQFLAILPSAKKVLYVFKDKSICTIVKKQALYLLIQNYFPSNSMNDSSKYSGDKSEIKINPKIKLLKKNARKRSLLENLESESTFQDLDELLGSVSQEEHILDEDKEIQHLKGKYEHYWLDRKKNVIHKEIVVIQPTGKVVLRAMKNMYFGTARFLLNSMLQINMQTLNEETPVPFTLLAYVGRHDLEDISCLHALCLQADPDNAPVCSYNLLVPIPKTTTHSVAQIIDVDSIEFVKLKHRYPELYNCLLRRAPSQATKVDW